MKQSVGELAERFGVESSNTDEALAPDFNVAPTKGCTGGGGASTAGRRRGR
jgi:hypothetical protein